MKLTELILQLHTIMLEKGNLDVYLIDDLGLHYEPEARYIEANTLLPRGVYLN